MSTRLRRTLMGTLPYVTVLALAGLTMPNEDRSTWFLIWLPLCAVMSLGMDWFVWNRPSRLRERQLRKEQAEARALAAARRATYKEA
jgi:hypothetical protein